MRKIPGPIRIPGAFFAGGVVFKALLLLLWRVIKPPELFGLLVTYDPGGSWFAHQMIALLFDQRRLAPGPAESAGFEVFLALGLGIECLLLGFGMQTILTQIRRIRLGRDAGLNRNVQL